MLSLIAVLAAPVLKGISLLVSYITHNTFPVPLSEKEEQQYLERLKTGEETARNVLIERNLRLVAHIIKKFDNTGEDVDDLISIGTIGLIKAINTFDTGKKIRLATYAARCIENEVLMHLRSTRRIRSEVSLYDPIGIDKEGNEFTLTVYLFSISHRSAASSKAFGQGKGCVFSFRYSWVNGQRELIALLAFFFSVGSLLQD